MMCAAKSTRTFRSAYSPIETIVAIGVAALLLGLLFPAVQKAREAAARSTCRNNLRQIGLGLHAHHAAQRAYPHGGADGPNYTATNKYRNNGATRKEWSWLFHITPYVDREDLFRLPDDSLGNKMVQMSPTSIFYCPAKRSPVVYNVGARTDYAGNAGDSLADNGSSGVFVRVYAGASQPPGTAPKPEQPPRRNEEIRDGLSNTIAVGEKQLHPTLMDNGNYVLAGGDNEAWNNSGWDEDCLRVGNRDGDPLPDVTGFYAIHSSGGGLAPDGQHPDADTIRWRVKDSSWWSRKFGASHPGGVNFLFLDGSVRTLSYGTDAEQFRRACTINDGATLALD